MVSKYDSRHREKPTCSVFFAKLEYVGMTRAGGEKGYPCKEYKMTGLRRMLREQDLRDCFCGLTLTDKFCDYAKDVIFPHDTLIDHLRHNEKVDAGKYPFSRENFKLWWYDKNDNLYGVFLLEWEHVLGKFTEKGLNFY